MTADLDRYWPPRGPCGLCGHPDARHREWDAIRSRYQAGETKESLSADYNVEEEAIVEVLDYMRRRAPRRD